MKMCRTDVGMCMCLALVPVLVVVLVACSSGGNGTDLGRSLSENVDSNNNNNNDQGNNNNNNNNQGNNNQDAIVDPGPIVTSTARMNSVPTHAEGSDYYDDHDDYVSYTSYISYEQIQSAIQSIGGEKRPQSGELLQQIEDYLRTLEGKNVDWQGWVISINPDKDILQQIEKAEKYTGDFRIWVSMIDPERDPTAADPEYTDGIAILRGTTQAQVEQFAKWHDPGALGSAQQVRFRGSIIGGILDPFTIFVSVSDVLLLK